MRAETSRVDPEDVLHLKLSTPLPGDARVLLRSDRGTIVAVSRLHRAGDHVRAELGELGLADGDWEVCVAEEDGDPQPLETTDPGFSLAERAAYLAVPRRRELGALRTPQGRLRITARTVRPYIEVEWIGIDHDTLTLRGVLAYTRRRPGRYPATLLARQRRGRGRVTAPAELEDGAVRCELPLSPLAEAHGTGRARHEWDLWLDTPLTRRGLRLGAHGDDIVRKKNRFAFPAATLRGGESRVRLRPYYTKGDNVSVRVAIPAMDTENGAR